MPSLLDDPYRPNTGLLGLPAPNIAPPDDRTVDQGDALTSLYQTVMDKVKRERQISADRGLWNDETGRPTTKGLLDAGSQWVTTFEGGIKATPKVPTPGLLAVPLVRGEADRVSPSLPTARGLDYDPHTVSDNQIGADAIKGTSAEAKVRAKLAEYPDVPTPDLSSTDSVFGAATKHFKDNMRWIYDNMVPEVRDIAKNWYDGAHKMTSDLADEHGLPHRAVAGMTARLSPGTDWYQNFSMAKRILNISRDQADNPMSEGQRALVNSYIDQQKNPKVADVLRAHLIGMQDVPYGSLEHDLQRALYIRSFDEHATSLDPTNGQYPKIHPNGYEMGPALKNDGTPETLGWQSLDNISRSVNMMRTPEVPNISKQLGEAHKIRSFNNNIVSPDAPHGDVTADTHQIAAAHLMPLGSSSPVVNVGMSGPPYANSTGATGLYGIYADATRELARELNLLPRQVQSITWEGARGLFPSAMKRNEKQVAAIKDLWSNSTNAAETRNAIGKLRGVDAGAAEPSRIPAPDWFVPRP